MNVIFLSTIGAVILLDKYALGEFGVSQPLVAGAIIGALFGDTQMGIFLGAMLQLVFLGGLPIGRDIPPDGQVAGITCCGAYFLLRTANPSGHALLVAILFALVGAVIGGTLDIFTRHYNNKFYRMFQKNKSQLSMYHLLGLVTAFARGFCIFLPFFALSSIIRVPDVVPHMSRHILLIICLSMGLANAVYLFIKKSTAVYVIIGGLCGLLLVVL